MTSTILSVTPQSSWQCLSKETWMEIVDWCPLPDRVVLRAVHPGLAEIVQYLFAQAFNRMFAGAGLDASTAIHIMHRNNALVSGSSVLLLLHRQFFNPGDIDFYVGAKEETWFMHDLEKDLHLKVDSTWKASNRKDPSIDYTNMDTIKKIHTLVTSDKKINVIVAKKFAHTPIFDFHSTAVMNFMSHDRVFCAYPELTFQRKSLINSSLYSRECTELDGRVRKCLWKYEQRGYEARASPTWPEFAGHKCGKDPSCPSTLRHTGDGGCYSVSIACLLGKPASKLKRLKWEATWAIETED